MTAAQRASAIVAAARAVLFEVVFMLNPFSSSLSMAEI
jgi:hypothetical protein